MKSQIHFLNATAAGLVAAATRRIVSGCDVELDKDPPSENDRKRGVGDWVVRCSLDDMGVSSSFGDAVEEGIEIALADALRKYAPNHPLLTGIWKLREENIPIRRKHKVVGWSEYLRNR